MRNICVPCLCAKPYSAYLTDTCPDMIEWDLRIEFELTTHSDFCCPDGSRDTCTGTYLRKINAVRSRLVKDEQTGQTGIVDLAG